LQNKNPDHMYTQNGTSNFRPITNVIIAFMFACGNFVCVCVCARINNMFFRTMITRICSNSLVSQMGGVEYAIT